MTSFKLLSAALFMFVIHASQPWPLPGKSASRKESSGHQFKLNPVRARRSIPEFDAVNPAYLDLESQPDQEKPMDPQGDLSPFSLTDQVGNLFRSQRPVKQELKSNARPVQGLRAFHLAREEESLDSGSLPADEQEECYRQQNIEPPQSGGASAKTVSQTKHGAPAMPVVGEPSGPAQADLLERKEESSQFNEDQDNYLKEKQEISSLYSDPKQVIKYKAKNQEIESPELQEVNDIKIFKPVNVQAEFPVYDEDINFVPDPLQGILDDKYWLDTANQEEAIKKYTDLATNNMMFDRTEQKRSAEQSDLKVKSVDSKAGFQNIERQCPCQELSSCGECSKGKGEKKSNYSESGDVGIPFGRKLLALNLEPEYDPDDLCFTKLEGGDNLDGFFEKRGSSGFSDDKEYYKLESNESPFDVNEDGDSLNYNFPDNSKFVGRKLLSLEWADEENDDDELIEDASSNSESDTQFNSGDHGLAYKQYDGNEESYNDDEYDRQETGNAHKTPVTKETLKHEIENDHEGSEHDKLYFSLEDTNNKDPKGKSTKQETDKRCISMNHPSHGSPEVSSGYYEPNKLANLLQKPFEVKTKELKDNTTRFEGESWQNKPNDNNKNKQNLESNGNPHSDSPDNPPPYNVSNKLVNVFQKPFQDKQKGPTKGVVGPSLEFKQLHNESIYNSSLELVSDKPSKSINLNTLSPSKTRRSFPDTVLIKSPQRLLESSKHSAGSNNGERNKRTNPSASSNTSLNLNNTATSGSLSLTTNLPSPTNSKVQSTIVTETSKKMFEEDEIDSKVANNIVESIIKESQSGSAVGQNLGICRKSESVISKKYDTMVPEAEKILKSVTNCIVEKIKGHMSQQSCALLDPEMLEFLKWMVLGGESYKDYMQKLGPEFFDFVPAANGPSKTSQFSSSGELGEPEPLLQNEKLGMAVKTNESEKTPG